MEIIIGKSAGFCYGVKRAIEGATLELKKYKRIYALGELVHNKEVINSLEEKGLVTINDIEKAKEICIIRAHGEPKKTYEKAKKLNIKLVDFTCPNVIKNHKLVEEYHNKGYYVILLGNPNHPENIGTISYCDGYGVCIDIEQIDEVKEYINKEKIKKILILAQTTYSLSKFYNCIEKIKSNLKDKEIEIINTICKATEIRQKETEELSKKVDCMIIVGGKNSSNTNKLYDISKNNCKNTMLVENIDEINFKNLECYSKVGIMAGASTPDSSFKKAKN